MLFAACAIALLTAAIALRTAAKPATASTPPGGACSHQQASAVNQYCENIPSATGGNQAGPGTPPLSSQLAPSVSTRLGGAGVRVSGAPSRAGGRRHGRAQSRKASASRLFGLPAPGAHLPFPDARHAAASGWSLFSGLLIVLAALAMALGAVAVVRRRISQASP